MIDLVQTPRRKTKKFEASDFFSCSFSTGEGKFGFDGLRGGRDAYGSTESVLGHMLRSKTTDEWRSIVNNKIWDLPEGEKRILSILKLSFDELKPSSLKQCFAYCSMFFKDFDIEKDDLIQLWMAQDGFTLVLTKV
ncbi:putative P-loop containing nucleoside triphosphate hydrolase [Rosa chinensis]|uniref:Putative P-loop containing nucleoside triphosphate hydrolase n=1 Tax=Rosa chinensis TaxID=74649 RepID=A0A2P6RG18_ROSCH|nr:putative P-loop containing nucleoside triphosphate hydrolase [Rosa chinensis]